MVSMAGNLDCFATTRKEQNCGTFRTTLYLVYFILYAFINTPTTSLRSMTTFALLPMM